MVNDSRLSTKNLILSRLRALGGAPVSGEVLAGELGLSRVAVWKAAGALKEAGYAVEASDEGYRLKESDGEDFLYPWEFGDMEKRFRHYGETTSTMDRARELSGKGAAPGTVVVAERQSAGKGRAGRSWVSETGGLFFTMTLAPGAPLLRCGRVAAAAQLAACAALEKAVGRGARPRWPNDVYARGGKIAGVLVEVEASGDRISRLSLGIGVNVNKRPEGAASCAELAGRRVSRREVLAAFLAAFEKEKPFEDGSLPARWNAAAEGVGGRVRLIDPGHGARGDRCGQRTERADSLGAGVFSGIDELGRAIVETNVGVEYREPGSASLIIG